jgi:Ca2+/H+ antiporter
MKYRTKIINVITSVVTLSMLVSQAGAEIAEALGDWDGELINLAAIVPAIIFIIRRVTTVAKAERGLS